MQFSELYGEALNHELGSADVTNLFTTVRRKAAINKAALEWVKQTESFVKWVDVTMVDEQQEYDLDSTGVVSAADFLWVAKEGAEYAHTDANGNVSYASGDEFVRRDLEWLNRNELGWRNAPSARLPQLHYEREQSGATYLGIWPKPDIGASESAIVKLPYVAKPADMSADGDEPFSVSSDTKKRLQPWHQALVHFAAAILEPLRKNYTGEQRQRALFAAQVADYLSKKRPKGGQQVQLATNYYRNAQRRTGFNPRYDPLVFP
jgi:hypothetical protein